MAERFTIRTFPSRIALASSLLNEDLPDKPYVIFELVDGRKIHCHVFNINTRNCTLVVSGQYMNSAERTVGSFEANFANMKFNFT